MLKWKIGLVLVLLLMILNTASAGQIELVGQCNVYQMDTGYCGFNVAVAGNFAYITYSERDIAGLIIIDVSDPSEPTIEGLSIIDEDLTSLTVCDDYAYVTSYGGFFIIDISTPSRPIKIGENSSIRAEDVVVSGNYAYLAESAACGCCGLCVVDISNPSNPTKAGEYTEEKLILHRVFVLENYLYMTGSKSPYSQDRQDGLYIFDISDPSNPIKEGYISGDFTYLAVSDNNAYVSPWSGCNLYDVDVSDKSNPLIVNIYRDPSCKRGSGGPLNSLYRLAASRNYAGVFVGADLCVVDMSQRPPVKIGEYFINKPGDLALSGDYIYVVSDGDGFSILKLDTTPDTAPPAISIDQPLEGQIFTDDTITVCGSTSDESGIHSVTVNGKYAGTTSWSKSITLSLGINTITIMATDGEGNTKTVHRTVTYRTPTKSPIHISMPIPTPTKSPIPVSTLIPTPTLAQEDSDGDGVPDKYDYAPSDPNVQSKGDIKTPGFEVTFAILGLLAVAFIMRRRR